MEFYEKPELEDLYHFGIKGMRWGHRRTQEELDRAAGRWREKELKKVEKREGKRVARLEKSYNRSLDGKSFKKMYKNREKLDKARVDKFLEEEYIRDMSWDDIKKEYSKINKAYIKAYIFGTGEYYNGSLPLYDFKRGYRIKKQYKKLKDDTSKIDPDTRLLANEFYKKRN